ncbi:MAG: ATP-binding protein [Microbacterium sp.]|uniref:sensor histidine kinase n=1 Tax=Microbacterium sp. TaxID=51671 RepID=UPI0039E2684E
MRWGFRARLAALIAGVFILGGAVLLGVQYLLVRGLFEHGIDTLMTGCVTELPDGAAVSVTGESSAAEIDELCAQHAVTVGGTGDVTSIVLGQTMSLSQEVLSGLLVGSAIVLLVFAAVAVLAAWWLSKRTLGRIARITETSREISRDDLHTRLSLPGPDDEVKELGDTIDAMLDRLEDAFTRQERFIAGASHELRTPLATTRTLLEIPLEQGRIPAELEPDVRRALAANERSEQLIAALLTLARSRTAHEPRAADPADLTAVARDVLGEHEPLVGGLAVTPPGSGPVLAVADPGLLRIAVANLIENAIRHNHDDGMVAVRTGGDDSESWIEVENSGRDLAGQDLRALAEPFHRGEHTRLAADAASGQGLGLGLALVESVARSQDGTLALSARDGGGLVVRLTLPAPAARASRVI